MREPVYWGNMELLERRKTGFLASRSIATTAVIPALEWALGVSKEEQAVVVSGFHSPLERKVLGTLLKGRCGLIIILARGMYRKLPARLEEPMRSGRLLLISYEHPSVTRASELTAHRRNDNVRQLADTMYRPSDIEAAGAR